jgi:hypothetical protein
MLLSPPPPICWVFCPKTESDLQEELKLCQTSRRCRSVGKLGCEGERAGVEVGEFEM